MSGRVLAKLYNVRFIQIEFRNYLFLYYTGANIPPTDFIVVHYTSVFHKKIATWGIVW